MSATLSNYKDLVANSVSIIQGSQVIDLLDTNNSAQGLTPSTSNSLETNLLTLWILILLLISL